MEEVGFLIIASLLITAAFSIADKEHVTPEQYEYITSLCENNKGLKYLDIDFTEVQVTCNNEAMFTAPVFNVDFYNKEIEK